MTEELVKRLRGDHERIFLQPNCCADAHYGRQWCEHDVWGDDCEDHTPATEYVRADAIEALQAKVERLTYDGIHTCHDDCPRLPCVQRREIEGLRAEVERLRKALRACRRAVSAGRDEPRLNVREIVDEAIEEHQRHLMNELQAHKDALAQAAPKP